jgi:hypothetical protein
MLKKLNNIIERIGVDKLLHLLLFAWVVAEAKMFGDVVMWAAYWLMAVLSIAKEIWLDNKGDLKDVLYGAAGGGISVLMSYLSILV